MVNQPMVVVESFNNQLLPKEHPYLSLLQLSLANNLMERKEFLAIQSQTMVLLKDLIQRYTKWESSSVKVETAENLLNSIYYALDTALESCPILKSALAHLRSHGVSNIYQRGVEMITEKVREAEAIYQSLVCKKPELKHLYYDATVNEAIPAFFRQYHILFAAHDIPADIDYPILFDNQSKKGIAYMLHYIRNLELEASFLGLFDTDKVRRCLEEYGRMYRIDFRNTFMNLMEPIFNQALFALVSGERARSLILPMDRFRLLVGQLSAFDSEALTAAIQKAFDSLKYELAISRNDLLDLLQKQLAVLVKSIMRAKETSSYHHLIIVEKNVEKHPILLLEEKGRMTDSDFKKLVQKLLDVEVPREKTLLIRSKCQNAGDFIDLMESGCLLEEDYQDLFRSLSDEELAVLSRQSLWDWIRENRLSQIIYGWNGPREYWCSKLIIFLTQLGTERLNHLEDIIERLIQ